jgi:hypothetical protein
LEENVGKTKAMKISSKPSPIQIVTDRTQFENVEYFSCLGSVIACDAVGSWEIKSNNMKNIFTTKLDLNLRKKLVKCYIRYKCLYGVEIWTLRAVD